MDSKINAIFDLFDFNRDRAISKDDLTILFISQRPGDEEPVVSGARARNPQIRTVKP